MPDNFRIAIAQINPTVGALEANAQLVKSVVDNLHGQNVDFVVFPELFLSGYPLQDLVTKRAFVRDCMATMEELSKWNQSSVAIGIGCPWAIDQKIYNCYLILKNGQIVATIQKYHLPSNEVFDEVREFAQGSLCGPYQINDVKIGTPICEDAWYGDVCEMLVESGADILIVPNGSPYARNKNEQRINIMVSRVVETGLPLIYLNLVGGQDDQVFDGGSFVLNKGGSLAAQLPHFKECVEVIDFEMKQDVWEAKTGSLSLIPTSIEMDYHAISIGVRDYLAKSGFSSVLIGLSGGIDSAFVATIATDVVGPKNTYCVMLPTEFTSESSTKDAHDLATNLGCDLTYIGMGGILEETLILLESLFQGRKPDATEENIQSRMRALLLMALSNKFGYLVLTTGNKSEAAVGYTTIYGDMAGGYNPIKDLYKTRLIEVARWRNSNFRPWMKGPEGQVIPDNILTKPPSAELRADQKDTDSLPAYDILDRILEMLIDEDRSVSEVVEKGFDIDMVKSIEQLIYASEYKRFQSAPGVRLSTRALWLDRRYPIVNHWRDRN